MIQLKSTLHRYALPFYVNNCAQLVDCFTHSTRASDDFVCPSPFGPRNYRNLSGCGIGDADMANVGLCLDTVGRSGIVTL